LEISTNFFKSSIQLMTKSIWEQKSTHRIGGNSLSHHLNQNRFPCL